RRGAARLAAVQALYQMDIAGTGLNEILAEFESHWIGREVEGAQYLPAEAAFFRDVVSGVVREQRSLDPLVDKVLSEGWPLKRIEAILRAVLRAGAYELGHRGDVPARVVVSEYVDVANAFVDRDETGMVNAVLDRIVGGVHFFPGDPPDTVARKALRVNLSDLAAKGARPLGFLLTLALPQDIDDAWLAPFARGLAADAEAFGCPLLGGDTDRTTGPVTISIAAFGAVPHGKMLRRAGAKAGDRVVVTGTIGDAALGLLLRRDVSAAARWGLTRAARGGLAARYLVPEPRLAIAEILRAHASAAMDVSDGLAGDLGKLCRA